MELVEIGLATVALATGALVAGRLVCDDPAIVRAGGS